MSLICFIYYVVLGLLLIEICVVSHDVNNIFFDAYVCRKGEKSADIRDGLRASFLYGCWFLRLAFVITEKEVLRIGFSYSLLSSYLTLYIFELNCFYSCFLSEMTSIDVRSLLLFSALFRVILILYGEWQDSHMEVRYTDVDYLVFSDAASLMASGVSPYKRTTYRYSPLLAFLLIPNSLIHRSWGKFLFSASGMNHICTLI